MNGLKTSFQSTTLLILTKNEKQTSRLKFKSMLCYVHYNKRTHHVWWRTDIHPITGDAFILAIQAYHDHAALCSHCLTTKTVPLIESSGDELHHHPSGKRIRTPQNTHSLSLTHTHRQTHVRAWKSEWEREKWRSETERDTLTLPLILLRCVGLSQSECLPSTHCGSFQSAFNPLIKLVMLLWTHSLLTGECAHAGLTNSNYVCCLLTLCEHI